MTVIDEGVEAAALQHRARPLGLDGGDRLEDDDEPVLGVVGHTKSFAPKARPVKAQPSVLYDGRMPDIVEVPFQVQKPQDGLRVDQYLAQRLQKHSRSAIQKLIGEGQVFVRGRAAKASARVSAGETILVRYPKTLEPECEHSSMKVLYEDEYLLALDKPGGVLSHPTDKIIDNAATTIVKKQFPSLPLFLTHRLDRETSGILIFAKTRAAARKMSVLFASHGVSKTYLALVRGRVAWQKKRVDAPLGREGLGIHVRQAVGAGQAAVTDFERLDASDSKSLVRARPKTGRLHQIRAHLAYLGHPILGDKLYTGDGALYMKTVRRELTDQDLIELGARRQMLHAACVEFKHPMSWAPVRVEAGLPDDFKDLLATVPGL